MRTPIHAFFAVLAAVATLVAVLAIKRGAEWGLQGASDTTLNLAVVLTIGPLLMLGAWVWLLRPLIERRKQRKDAGLR